MRHLVRSILLCAVCVLVARAQDITLQEACEADLLTLQPCRSGHAEYTQLCCAAVRALHDNGCFWYVRVYWGCVWGHVEMSIFVTTTHPTTAHGIRVRACRHGHKVHWLPCTPPTHTARGCRLHARNTLRMYLLYR